MGVCSPIKGPTSNARGSANITIGRGGVSVLETNNSQVTGATKRGILICIKLSGSNYIYIYLAYLV